MKTTLIITLALLIAPLITTLILGAILDYTRRRRAMDPRRARKARAAGKKQANEEKPSATGGIIKKISAGLTDQRLLSKKFERTDKWGINISPSPLAPTWRRVYLILIIIQTALAYLGASSRSIPMMVASVAVGFITLGMITSNGGKCLKSSQQIYDRMFKVLSQHMHLDKDADPKQYINVQDWTLPDEPQIIADAKVQARQDGEYDQLSKDLPENLKHRPKVASFRTTPVTMTVTFPVEFRKDATDDTLAHLNEIFGGKTEWVAEKEVPDGKGGVRTESGWEFENGIVYLRTVPPLPTMAALPENFNEGPYNIIKLGATVSGEGVWDINTTPMALVPLAVDTMIWVEADNGWDAKRLDRVHAGDTVISAGGEPVKVAALTPKHMPDDMYAITFRDYGREAWQGSLFTVHSAGSHLWPVDTSATNMQIIPEEERLKGHETIESVSTRAIYRMAREGNRAMLRPVQTSQGTVRWVSYSVVMETPSEVMCLNVDSEDHTFLIACTHDSQEQPAHADSIDTALKDGIPTHNCGSPLALDTPVPMYDGTMKTMGDITPGDVVIGSDGNPADVVSASPVMMPEHLYRMTLEPADDAGTPYSKDEGTKADTESA